jgi:hypothetical protein
MHGDSATAATAAAPAHRHVNPPGANLRDAPQRRRAAMAQQRIVTTGKYGGHERAVPGQPHVADGVDTDVQAMQPAGANPPAHRRSVESDGKELSGRHHSMLPAGELRNYLVRWAAYVSHTET